MHAMTDMELDDEDQMDACVPVDCPKPKYPYGLRICLTESEMQKLGIEASDAFVGGIVHLHALAKITSVSCNEMETGTGESVENSRIELQICAMAVESEDEENREADRLNGRRALYNQ